MSSDRRPPREIWRDAATQLGERAVRAAAERALPRLADRLDLSDRLS